VTEKKDKANPKHFLKFLLASRTSRHTNPSLQKSRFLQTHRETDFNFEIL